MTFFPSFLMGSHFLYSFLHKSSLNLYLTCSNMACSGAPMVTNIYKSMCTPNMVAAYFAVMNDDVPMPQDVNPLHLKPKSYKKSYKNLASCAPK